MSIVYLVALAAFCAVLFGVLWEAVVSVSRKPAWHSAAAPSLALVETADRREQQLPFVGRERRLAEEAKAAAGTTNAKPADASAPRRAA